MSLLAKVRQKVLLVDDSKVVLAFHSHILEGAGFECITAENGFDALEKLNLNAIEIILTDLNMPKMDGYEFVRRVREQNSYKDTPIIMISTEQEGHDREKGIEAGANLYMVKPTEPEELIGQIQMLISRSV